MLPWSQKIGIKFPKNINLNHKISTNKVAAAADTPHQQPTSSHPPLRGIFTETKISKGQLIAILPLHQSAILPRHGARYLQQQQHQNNSKNSTNKNKIYQTSLKMASQNPFSIEMAKRRRIIEQSDNSSSNRLHHHHQNQFLLLPWFSRDQIVLASALASWKMFRKMELQQQHQQKQKNSNSNMQNEQNQKFFVSSSSSWKPFDDYLKILPRGVPFTATELQRSKMMNGNKSNNNDDNESNNTVNDKKNKKVTLNRFATPMDVRPTISSSDLQQQHIATTRRNSTNAVPTSSFNMEETLTSNKHLTQPAHIGLLGKSLNYLSSGFANSFVEEFLSDNHNNQNHSKNMSDLELLSEARTSFEWAHFMLRSRSLSPLLNAATDGTKDSSSGSASPYNKRRSSKTNEDDEQINIADGVDQIASSSFSIYSDSPLLLPFVDMMNHSMKNANITVAWNRGASLTNAHNPDEVEILVSASHDIEAGSELLLNYANHRQRGRYMFAPDVHLLARDEDMYASPAEKLAVTRLLGAQRNSGVCEDVLSWEWQYGFPIPQDELDFVRELLWANSLKGRVRRMMNIRRRGRPGEFVVGVPEGLAALKKQRERIERESYGGRTVFPPQAE